MGTKTLEQNSAQDLAGLQVDILQKLRTGNMSWEQIDWFKNLSFEKREKLIGKSISNIEHPKMKLQNSNIVVDALTEEINPLKYFTENKKVKYYLGDNFKKYVLNGVKTINGLPQTNFSKHKFTETIYDKEIMKHFHISESNGLMTPEKSFGQLFS
jgi:ABC-type antimicrobial peptide transport system ATPase subunit